MHAIIIIILYQQFICSEQIPAFLMLYAIQAITRDKVNFSEFDRFFNSFWDNIPVVTDEVSNYVINVVLANRFNSMLAEKFIQMLVVN